jgi:hypothetical protein
VLVGRLGPLQHEVERGPLSRFEDERHVVHRLRAALRDDLLQVVGQPFLCWKTSFVLGLVLEGDATPLWM